MKIGLDNIEGNLDWTILKETWIGQCSRKLGLDNIQGNLDWTIFKEI